ncbi:MAG: 6-phosphofructokinase [Parasporobacterium sp.]|nr:6-phosphofructokinase [Parasporobacterium sp.]
MNKLVGACIVGQSGGPTAVINSSLYGVIDAALKNPNITRVLGADHGITGVINDILYDMGQEDQLELEYLKYTPAAALGSCRYKMRDAASDSTDYYKILDTFKKHDVRYFFYIGGNDSMDTCNKISKFMQAEGYECRVIGVPKTIDNDLAGTDHCPGFGSAAKFIATVCTELASEAYAYTPGSVVVTEIMGRNAGWLAGSAGLASYMGDGPDLVYLPEIPFEMEKFLDDVEKVYKKQGHCLIAISEGVRYKDGSFVSHVKTSVSDGFGHAQLGGLAPLLAYAIQNRIGCKTRAIELSLLQRCAGHCASMTDIDEAFAAGNAALNFAADEGITDKMVAYRRIIDHGKYVCVPTMVDLDEAANDERKVPREWINEEGNGVTEDFIEYVMPLIQGEIPDIKHSSLPRYAHLKKVRV